MESGTLRTCTYGTSARNDIVICSIALLAVPLSEGKANHQQSSAAGETHSHGPHDTDDLSRIGRFRKEKDHWSGKDEAQAENHETQTQTCGVVGLHESSARMS